MSNGQFRTFDQFDWNSTQPASTQRANVQRAFDSGEPLLMPFGENVTIDDVGLNINNRLRLMGHGSDITNSANGASQFITNAPNADVLRILASNVILEHFNIHANAPGGHALVIGDGTSAHIPFGTNLIGLSTGSNFRVGIEVMSAQEDVWEDLWINAQDVGILINDRVSADQGDRRMRGGEINAYGPQGIGLLLQSGGGFIAEGGTKFLNCWKHIMVDWRFGGSGNLIIDECSLENCRGSISVDMDGTMPFIRARFSNNSCGNGSVAFVVRNFRPTPWLRNLSIQDNNIDMGAPLPAIDVGSVDEVFIDGNDIDGGNAATAGIVIRNPATGSIGNNLIRRLGPGGQPIVRPDGNTAVTQSPYQG